MTRNGVRPPESEPVRPPDPLDLISHDPARAQNAGLAKAATKAVQSLTRVTHAKAMALIGDGLGNALKKRGEHDDPAWQAIADLPEDEQRAGVVLGIRTRVAGRLGDRARDLLCKRWI